MMARYGLEIGWDLAGSVWSTEIEVAPDSGGSPDTANSDTFLLGPGVHRYIAEKPRDGATWHFRVRHVREGYDPSSWVGWIAGEATDLGSGDPPTITQAQGIFEAESLQLLVWPGPKTESLKYALSTSSQPARETGTNQDTTPGTYLVIDTGQTYGFEDTVYVTLTPYSEDSAGGIAGPAYLLQLRPGWPKDHGDPTGAEQLAKNGDFENGLAYWTGPSQVSIETTDPYKGSKALKIASDGSGREAKQSPDPRDALGDGSTYRLVRVEPGDIIRCKAAGKRTSGSGTGNMRVRRYDADESYLGVSAVLSWTETSWTEKEETYAIPAGVYYLVLTFLSPANNTFLFDEVNVWRVKKAKDIDNDLITPDGQLNSAVGVSEGSAVYKIYRHREEITVQGPDSDGDVPITFSQSYQDVPAILFGGAQLVSFSETLGTGTGVQHRLRLKPTNKSASGFTSRAQITNIGSTTDQDDDFPSGNLLDAEGETTEANLDPSAANDDTYTVHYYVEVTADQADPGTINSAQLKVAIDSNDGGGWVERATFTYSVYTDETAPATDTWTHEQKEIVVSGLGLNDDIRLRAKSFTVTQTGSFKVRGGDGTGSNPETFNGVTYTTATDTVESAIPDTGDSVTWVAQEVS